MPFALHLRGARKEDGAMLRQRRQISASARRQSCRTKQRLRACSTPRPVAIIVEQALRALHPTRYATAGVACPLSCLIGVHRRVSAAQCLLPSFHLVAVLPAKANAMAAICFRSQGSASEQSRDRLVSMPTAMGLASLTILPGSAFTRDHIIKRISYHKMQT